VATTDQTTLDRPTACSDDPRDDAGFGRWYAERWEPTRRLATHLVGDRTVAEDIASEVLLNVWRRWQVAGPPDAPDAYLARAVRNRVASHFRTEARARALTARLGAAEVAPDHAGPVADRDAVVDLLGRLPEAERTTMSMIYLDGLTAAEVARRLGLQPASVRSRVLRGRRRLALAV
jgi:RNA polymerase sigma factor (sigma-70 family)